MRPRRRGVFVPVAAVAASTVLLGCHRGDSILLVEVAGDLRLQPASFAVAVEPAQAAEKTFRVVPESGGTVTLPASLSIQMAPNLTGPVTVTVGAFDLNGLSIGYGSTTQTDINVGGETIVVVTLTPTTPFPVDAGMDAAFGTGGGGVDAGGAGGSSAAGSSGAAASGLGGRGGVGGGAAGAGGKGGSAGTGGSTGSGGKGGSTGTGGVVGGGGMVGAAGASGAAGKSGTAGTTGAGGAAGSAKDAGGDA